jgi:hypothetical protein
MNKEKQIEDGCGYQETYNKSSFCKKGNLCIDCSEHLEIYNEARKETLIEVEKMIDNLKKKEVEYGRK